MSGSRTRSRDRRSGSSRFPPRPVGAGSRWSTSIAIHGRGRGAGPHPHRRHGDVRHPVGRSEVSGRQKGKRCQEGRPHRPASRRGARPSMERERGRVATFGRSPRWNRIALGWWRACRPGDPVRVATAGKVNDKGLPTCFSSPSDPLHHAGDVHRRDPDRRPTHAVRRSRAVRRSPRYRTAYPAYGILTEAGLQAAR